VEIVYVPVLDPKIIDNKTEGNLRRNMTKERGGGCLVVTVLGEMGHELLISMKPGLGKAWDSIDNLSIPGLRKAGNSFGCSRHFLQKAKKNLRLCCDQKYLQAFSSFITHTTY